MKLKIALSNFTKKNFAILMYVEPVDCFWYHGHLRYVDPTYPVLGCEYLHLSHSATGRASQRRPVLRSCLQE